MSSTLKSVFSNQYVSAEGQGASPLVANRTTAAEWETFTVNENSDGTVSFLSAANNKYVTADLNQGTKLIARAASIQVTNGQIEVGIWHDANANNWAAFDHFELALQ